MATFITVPIDTDPQAILDDVYAFLQSVIPGWTPALGNLDVWIAMAIAVVAAENRDVASNVPPAIFRYYGNSVLNFPPIDATPAHTTTTWTMQDNAGYTIPDGAQVSVTGPDEQQVVFITVGATIVPPGSTTAVGVPITAVTDGEAGSGLGGVGTPMTLQDPLAFVVSVVQLAVTTGGQDAESDDDYLNRLASDLQLLTPRPILPSDFAVLLRNIPGVYRATAIDGYNPFHNLLTLNDASVETTVAGWAALANCAIVQTAAQAADGTKSIQITASSAADMSVELVPGDAIVVAPGDTITALASYRSAVTGRNCKTGLAFVDAGGALIGSIVYGSTVADITTGWMQASVVGAAPALAAKVRQVLFVTAPANAEVHYADKMSIRRGTGTDWVPGGTAETGNPRMVSVAGIDQSGNPLDAGTKTAGANYLQSLREVNFIVNVVDPTVTPIDVTYQIHLLPGFSSATVLANVNAAISAFLAPAAWGSADSDPLAWSNTALVRLNKMIQVIENVIGVDYAPTTQVKLAIHGNTPTAADVTLPGVAPLPLASVLTGTVV